MQREEMRSGKSGLEEVVDEGKKRDGSRNMGEFQVVGVREEWVNGMKELGG